MKKIGLQIFFILLTFTSSYAQSYKTLSKEEKQFFRLQSQLLFKVKDINKASIDTLLASKQDFAIEYAGQSDLILIKYILKRKKKLTLITNSDLSNLLEKYPRILQINPSQIEFLNLQNKNVIDNKKPLFKELEKLSSINFINNKKVTDSIVFRVWERSGKLPNFIYADSNSVAKTSKLVSFLNSTEKIFGVVKTKEKLLKNVLFKNFPNRKANGYFSFPLHFFGKSPILIPYKAGYYFSPDIIYANVKNIANSKEFIGFPLDLTFGLTDSFEFEKKVLNRIRKNNNNIISKQVEIVNDSVLGKVGFFNKRAYIDAGIESRRALKTSFTITAWIKPTELGVANSILGKGEHFVLKVHRGYLTFTMAGIKDYISFSSPIPIDKWTHVSLVYSEVHNALYFYINGKITDTVSLISNYTTSNHNLYIGNNLWEEFFIGYLGPINIWERELNSSEIFLLYKQKSVKNTNYNLSYYLWAGILVLISFFTFYLLKRNKRKSALKTTKNIRPPVVLPVETYKEKFCCFGSLQVVNKENVDIAPKLSPKLKQLFLIVFLESVKNGTGITTKKLTEILWPGMDTRSAKNTRGTNIQKLRALLSTCSEINLLFIDKHWFLEISDNCYCDYILANSYIELFANQQYNASLLEEKLPILLKLLKRGKLFTNTSATWLDPYIEKFSYKITKECFHYVDSLSIEKHSDILLETIEIIHFYDDLNEKALQLKLKILIHQGKLSLAHLLYDNFSKLYKNIYKENYPITFEKSIS
ncbi:hypothetical protein JL193_08640 [Polaribacter batillariae]|uniref:LamG-like jellyroll fold domain-containing protein n=1 Tax=Polaribacter batillariae TaxID=2808900 RepID=A0ABX7SPT7_9FLAO|nr:LamG-like jellyroll fold domain-containing protein [Polaribacter batillariae]QTD36235.1 hypothetical protein JL193_08640 [Polaribacter batillariae]